MLTVDFNEVSLKSGMRVLDAGCGTGRHLCEAFRTPGVEVAGMDLNNADLCTAKAFLFAMASEKGGNWIVARAEITGLPFRDSAVDVVVCSEVLEHVPDNKNAVAELVRVLKPGGSLVVTVPRFLPERICWMISEAYHQEPGGHIRIYKKRELMNLLEEAGVRCWRIQYRHGLHSPYWWLKCVVGHRNERSPLVAAYRRFLEWDIVHRPRLTKIIDRFLNPLIGKSVIFYLKKGSC